MTSDIAKALDRIGWKILGELQRDARIPFAELGRRVSLSTPAVVERVRRMEDLGIITGYHASVDAAKVGFPIRAFIRISVVGDLLPRIIEVAREMAEILECHRVTGPDSFIMKANVESIEHLQTVIDRLTPYVATNTAIILSSAVTTRPSTGDLRR